MHLKYKAGGLCRNGHLLDEANLYIKPSDKSKNCRICRAKSNKTDYVKNREKRLQRSKLWAVTNLDKRRVHARRSHLKIKFGVTSQLYNEMLEKQGGKCAICQQTNKDFVDSRGRERPSLFIDHCHNKNKIRGLLCSQCNMGLGHFKDNPELMKKAIQYLVVAEKIHAD